MCRKTGSGRNPRLFPFLLLLLTLMACSSQEQDLPFDTIAQRGIINYRKQQPALFVIAKAEDVDGLVASVLAEDPQLTKQLFALDYDGVFIILALHGYIGATGYSITVQRVTRQGDQVTVWAERVSPGPETRRSPLFTSPYHLVAVAKSGGWGKQMRFVLMDGDQPVAESQHFIP